jgi:hypothetical protein
LQTGQLAIQSAVLLTSRSPVACKQPGCFIAPTFFQRSQSKHGAVSSNRELLEKRCAYATIDAMILPKFSIRAMLIATAVFAVLSLVLAQAVRGEATTAIAFLLGIGSIAVAMGLYFWAFGVAWACAWLLRNVAGAGKAPVVGSPFADARPPKQIIAPVDPE